MGVYANVSKYSEMRFKPLNREFNGQVLASANIELHNKILQIINS